MIIWYGSIMYGRNIGQMAAAASAAHLHPMVQIFDDAEA